MGRVIDLRAPARLHGARVKRSAALSGVNITSGLLVPWDVAEYDTDGAFGRASTVTITIASPGVVSWNNHGLAAGAPVVFSTTGALPTGLTAGTVYFVVSPTTNGFSVAATIGGSAINTSGSQSGVHTATNGSRLYVPAGMGFTRARVGYALFIGANDALSYVGAWLQKNGSLDFAGNPGSITDNSSTGARVTGDTGWMPATGGDYFEVLATAESDTAVNVLETRSGAWIEFA